MILDLFDQLGFQVSKNGVIIQSVDIVSAFPSVFTGFGKIAKFVHRPRVKPEVIPVSQGLRSLPFSVHEEVSREKDEPCKSMTGDYVMEVELDNLVTPLELKAASSTDVTLMSLHPEWLAPAPTCWIGNLLPAEKRTFCV